MREERMTQPWNPAQGGMTRPPRRGEPASLADILERVLDKGIVVAGDIRVDLLDIELLTIRLRLIIASVDRAREMGIDWWEHDPALSSSARDLEQENRELRERVGELEAGGQSGQPASRGSRQRAASPAGMAQRTSPAGMAQRTSPAGMARR